jgi:hypothetical protein
MSETHSQGDKVSAGKANGKTPVAPTTSASGGGAKAAAVVTPPAKGMSAKSPAVPNASAWGGGAKAAAVATPPAKGMSAKSPAAATPSASTKIDDIFLQAMVVVARRDGYADPTNIVKEAVTISIFGTEAFKKTARYKDVCELHEQISSAIDAYFLSSPIRLVSECETFVTKQVAEWMHLFKKVKHSITGFEDFGLGKFHCIRHVQSLFKLKSTQKLPLEITHADVVKSLMSISLVAAGVERSVPRPSPTHGSYSDCALVPQKLMGKVIGSKFSVLKLIQELTGTRLTVADDEGIDIEGDSPEDVANAKNMVEIVCAKGVAGIKNHFHKVFETRLEFLLKIKHPAITSLDGCGVIVSACSLHQHIVPFLQGFEETVKKCSSEFQREFSSNLWKSWKSFIDSRRQTVVGSIPFCNESAYDVLDKSISHLSGMKGTFEEIYDGICTGIT